MTITCITYSPDLSSATKEAGEMQGKCELDKVQTYASSEGQSVTANTFLCFLLMSDQFQLYKTNIRLYINMNGQLCMGQRGRPSPFTI
jgi:hypothetical protein